MPSCDKCKKEFRCRSNLERHLNRQKPCTVIKICENKQIVCKYCKKLFSTDYNLRAHSTCCKVQNNVIRLCQYYEKIILQKDELIKRKNGLIRDNTVNEDLESIDSEEVSEYEDSSDSEDTEIVESKIYSSSDLHNKNYIYIIQEREFIKTKEPIYKIGRTKHGYIKRLKNYPKNSVVLCILKVPDSLSYERALIKEFDKKFIKRTDIGNEYYEGDPAKLIKTFCKITSKLNMSR